MREEIIKQISLEDVIEIYNQGYSAGHHDTVEAGYTDIHHSDVREYHRDVVMEILIEMEKKP